MRCLDEQTTLIHRDVNDLLIDQEVHHLLRSNSSSMPSFVMNKFTNFDLQGFGSWDPCLYKQPQLSQLPPAFRVCTALVGQGLFHIA